MSLKIISGDLIDETLGSQLAESVRRSIHESGDCQTCGRQLISGDHVKIGVQDDQTVVSVWVRHASCAPTNNDVGVIMVGPATYRCLSLALPSETPQRTGLFRRKTVDRKLLPEVIINPSIDNFTMFRDADGKLPSSVLESYTRNTGFEWGTFTIDNGERAAVTGLHLEFKGGNLAINDHFGQEYLAPANLEVKKAIKESGGIVLVKTTEWFVEDIAARSMESVLEFLMDTDRYASVWIPAPAEV